MSTLMAAGVPDHAGSSELARTLPGIRTKHAVRVKRHRASLHKPSCVLKVSKTQMSSRWSSKIS
jgi:hypothetical protein